MTLNIEVINQEKAIATMETGLFFENSESLALAMSLLSEHGVVFKESSATYALARYEAFRSNSELPNGCQLTDAQLEDVAAKAFVDNEGLEKFSNEVDQVVAELSGVHILN